jgi:enoyl-CoA hydratase
MTEAVRLETQDGIARLILDRPEHRNALTWDAMSLFARAVESAHAEADVRALIVTGGGEAFCAGGDLYELDGFPTRIDGARLSAVMASALDRLEQLPFPTIAAIEGPALGGGAEIALACDLRVMAQGASLGMMHIRLGITPAWGGGQRLLHLAGYARSLEWLAAGRVLSAEEALAFGLANRAVPRGSAMREALDLAQAIAAQDPDAVRAVKRLLRGGLTLSPDGAAAAERAEFPDLWASPAHLEASAAFLARRNHKSVR